MLNERYEPEPGDVEPELEKPWLTAKELGEQAMQNLVIRMETARAQGDKEGFNRYAELLNEEVAMWRCRVAMESLQTFATSQERQRPEFAQALYAYSEAYGHLTDEQKSYIDEELEFSSMPDEAGIELMDIDTDEIPPAANSGPTVH